MALTTWWADALRSSSAWTNDAEVVEDDGGPFQRDDAVLPAIADRLPDALPVNLRLMLERFCMHRDVSQWGSAEAMAARDLLATAIGTGLAKEIPSRIVLTRSLVFARSRGILLHELRTAFVGAIQVAGLVDAWRPVLAALNWRTAMLWFGPERDEEPAWAKDEEQQWANAASPFVAWDRSPSRHETLLNGDASFMLDALFDLDTRTWCDAIDSLPTPRLVRSVFESMNLFEEPERLRNLIAVAPETFTPDGSWTRACSILFLADSVVDWIHDSERTLASAWRMTADSEEHQRARNEHDAFIKDGASECLQAFYKALLGRTDGPRLLSRLAPRLLSRARYEVWRHDVWPAARVARDALVAAIATAEDECTHLVVDLTLSATLTIPLQPEQSLNELLIAAHIFADATERKGKSSAHLAARLWSDLCALLSRADQNVLRVLAEDGTNTPGEYARLAGFLIAHLDAPPDRWGEAFIGLEKERRLAAMGGYEDLARMASSELLVRAGLFGVSVTMQRPSTATPIPDVRRHFETLMTSARRIYLTRRVEHKRTDGTIAWSMSLFAAIYGDDASAERARWIRFFSVSPTQSILAAWVMWKSDIDVTQVVLEHAAVDVDLRALVAAGCTPSRTYSGEEPTSWAIELQRVLVEKGERVCGSADRGPSGRA